MARGGDDPHGLKLKAPEGLPAAMEAEQAILGLILFDNAAYATLPPGLLATHFSEPFHQRLFQRIKLLLDRGDLADPVTLSAAMSSDPAFKELGGINYLGDLFEQAPSSANVNAYARAVMQVAVRRTLMKTGAELVKFGGDTAVEPDAILAELEETIGELHMAGSTLQLVSADDAMAATLDHIDNPGDTPSGVTTGFEPLDDHLGAMLPEDLIVLGGRPGMGKAQPKDAPVLRPDGSWTPIGRLREGDYVAAPDGEPSKVVAVHERGERPVFWVTLSDGRRTEACGDHLWRVSYREWPEPRALSTLKLQEMLTKARYQRRLSIDLIGGDFGDDAAPLPLHPYVLGALLGDGNLTNGQPRFTCADEEILDRVRALLPWRVEIGPVVGSYAYSIRARNKGRINVVTEALRDLGCMGVRGEAKSVPAAYLRAPRWVRIELLRGLLDTDGWAESQGAIRFASTSAQLARDVEYLVRSVGGIASTRSKAGGYVVGGEQRPGRTSYTVKIRHPDGHLLFALSRKAARAKRGRNASIRLHVASVELSRVADTRCITVSHPSALYVTKDFIVTHNSAVAGIISRNVAINGKGVIEIHAEMSVQQAWRRRLTATAYGLFASQAPAYSDLRKRRVNYDQRQMLERARETMAGIPLMAIKRTGLTLGRLRALVVHQQALWARQGIELGLVVIDHVGLIRTDREHTSRVDQQTEISNGLKALADNLKIPVLALAQLNRSVESRDNKRPTLPDLRDSGSWEQDADLVIGAYRDAYYARQEQEPSESAKGGATWAEWNERVRSPWIELLLLKVREGEPKTIKLWAHMPTNTVLGHAPDDSHGGFI